MPHAKKTLIILTLIGVAAISVWQWPELEASPAAPPVEEADVVGSQGSAASDRGGGSSNQVSAATDTSVWARRRSKQTATSDLESATRAFKEASDCLLYHTARHELRALLNDERLDDLSTKTAATLEDIDTTSSRYLEIARQTEAFCEGSDRQTLEQVYDEEIFKAALLGNPDAESCFVISNLSALPIKSADSLSFLEGRYLKHAPTFIKNALERGDPYVAQYALYRHLPSQAGHASALDDLEKADPYLTVQMARLASLRVLPDQRARLERWLGIVEEENLLQPQELRRAEAWAESAYERDFAGRPSINLDSKALCYSSPELAP